MCRYRAIKKATIILQSFARMRIAQVCCREWLAGPSPCKRGLSQEREGRQCLGRGPMRFLCLLAMLQLAYERRYNAVLQLQAFARMIKPR